ncbi:general secretion pathway protein J [Sinobacterium caligoides]|uniref:Type II secretion system protein J n=1 Tax=Sinobacterium caligoides TaxID=933926 RepID=A0A3N2DNG4_9GAMM|nr:type II secretion system minor pseudopilin GspJ [Sinobacterium caligoides]ROS01344.1 general secretion pathway protein J [Sinobacterium caligoides]
MRRQQGFTLIEVLVAMAISAVIGMLSYAALSGNITSMDVAQKHQQRLADLQLFYNVLSRDIREFIPRPVRSLDSTDRLPALQTGVGELYWLSLTRGGWRNPLSLPRSELQRVAYRWEGDKIYRGQWLVLDGISDESYRESPIIDEVSNVEINVFDQQGNEHSVWPLNNGSSAEPQMVEVIVTFNDLDEVRRIYALR